MSSPLPKHHNKVTTRRGAGPSQRGNRDLAAAAGGTGVSTTAVAPVVSRHLSLPDLHRQQYQHPSTSTHPQHDAVQYIPIAESGGSDTVFQFHPPHPPQHRGVRRLQQQQRQAMPPLSSLAGILDSPAPGSSDNSQSTVVQRTLPDISLGSLGSSFHSAVEGDTEYAHEYARKTPQPRRSYNPLAQETPANALLSVSPPATSVRRPSSQSALTRRRSRADSSGSDGEGDALDARYAGAGSDDEGVLGSLSLNVSHRRDNLRDTLRSSTSTSSYAGPSKRSGRHSVAAGANPMTLREQEQNVDALQKENFNLQLENHFLKERLASMAPDQVETAIKENVKLKVEILNMGKELKKTKKLLMQYERDLAAAARERDGKDAKRGSRDAESRELEAMWREEKERRDELEEELERERDANAETARAFEEELESARARADDQEEEISRLRDAADRAEDALENIRAEQAEREEREGLGDSVGLGRGRESRLVTKLEQENADLKAELEELREANGSLDEMEDQNNQLRDELAAAKIELNRREEELDELNAELDAKVREHDRELVEMLGTRERALDALQERESEISERESEMQEARRIVAEREDEIVALRDRVAELEADMDGMNDQLEETLRKIEEDNAEKEADLIASNHEIESLGQKVYVLEEALDEMRAREEELNNELQRGDEEREHFEDLVAALKEARRKAQDEVADLEAQHKRAVDAHTADRDAWESERASEADHHKRQLASRDQTNERLTAELEAARDRVAMRDRDLVSVQNALRSLEDERRKLGDERTSGQRSLELEIDRLRRDIAQCEDDLDRARGDLRDREEALHDRDLEVADLLEKVGELEGKLTTERQGRLAVSDKLDSTARSARQHEREATVLRERLEDLEPLLTETQNSQYQMQKQSEQQRQERTDLLLRVFKDVNRFLGVGDKDTATPANFGVFRDTLLQRLRSISGVRSDFDKRIKDTETRMEHKMNTLKRQLDTKWRALDSFEASVKKLEQARSQWRSKYQLKEGELDALKSRLATTERELAIFRAGTSASASASLNQSTELRRLTERARDAEKRATAAASTIAQLEQRFQESQARSGGAETKWEARVKEYENRLRIAGEKIKAEKQGGKERALQLEAQVRDLERQLDVVRKHSKRAEGVVANAAHLMDN